MKSAIRSFAIMIAIIAALFGLYLLMGSFIEDSMTNDTRTPEEKAAELEAEKELFPKLDQMYDAGDLEGLVTLANAQESDKIDMWNYEHYDLLYYYSRYVSARDDLLPLLASGKMTQIDARRLTEITFSFYYRCYDNTIGLAGNASDDDIKKLDEIRNDFFLDILHDRMGYTDDDMDAARGDLMENNYFHTDLADKFSDRYCERYK